jgi:hypothetical protein
MFCWRCVEKHREHKKAFFRDIFVSQNFEDVLQKTQAETGGKKILSAENILNMDYISGSLYGDVYYSLYNTYYGSYKMINENVFIKVLRNWEKQVKEEHRDGLNKALARMINCKHRNLVNSLFTIKTGGNLYIISERCDASLASWRFEVVRKAHYHPMVVVKIALQCFEALKAGHKYGGSH